MGSKNKSVLTAILTYLAMLIAPPGMAWGDEIRWFTNFAAAMKEAKEKNRPVLLDVYKVPCGPCQRMDMLVYRDPAVIKFINDHYIALKINGELESVRIKNRSPVDRFPTLMYLSSDLHLLESQEGALDASAFVEQAKGALTKLALLAPPAPVGTPFQVRARLGSGLVGRPDVFAVNRKFPSSGTFSAQPLNPREERKSRAREILVQAVDSYRKERWLTCLDLTRSITVFYPDLSESTEARQLEQSIGVERLERLEKDMVENLSQVYWELAQSRIRQNQTAQATAYMEKIVQSCPGTRYFSAAQEFLRSASRAPSEQHASINSNKQ